MEQRPSLVDFTSRPCIRANGLIRELRGPGDKSWGCKAERARGGVRSTGGGQGVVFVGMYVRSMYEYTWYACQRKRWADARDKADNPQVGWVGKVLYEQEGALGVCGCQAKHGPAETDESQGDKRRVLEPFRDRYVDRFDSTQQTASQASLTVQSILRRWT